ncbi:2-amino-4-hydroxy-6-hydroxymethyldihydropteridine diphosphokinase [Vibrio sp.]|nr:2-amino-4-hydroxy-6-hydroxymethyldihydropteridine diphosphokinase [Vibrio sp.]
MTRTQMHLAESVTCYLGVGSNIERCISIQLAVERLQRIDPELRISPIYESDSVGFTGHSFYNLVIELKTTLSLMQLRHHLRSLELELGRPQQAKKNQNRYIDIDILLYGNDVSIDPPLPREDIRRFAFVIQPLYDLCPSLIIPGSHQTVAEIHQSFIPIRGLTTIPKWF